ncbi:MAG TPA: c-type cytochrome [Blastocatellia bacterium]|jgi:mono/diheme cytochrome c family protein
MKALKLGLVVSLVALFFIACGNDRTNNNANPTTNQNSPSAGTVAPPATSGSATANGNSPGGPGSATGNPPAPATNANSAARAGGNSNTAGATGTASNIDAAALYVANKCTGCHGADGKGNPNIKEVPNFTDAAWQKKTPDADMIKTIKNGHKPMPAYKDKLNDQEIQAIVAYVRSFAK